MTAFILTPEKEATLRRLCAAMVTWDAIAAEIGCHRSSAQLIAKRLGIPGRNATWGRASGFTPEQDAEILRRCMAGDQSYAEIGKAMGLKRNAVLGRAHRLDITKPKSRPAQHVAPPKPAASSFWTPERTEIVRKGAATNRSSRELAAELGCKQSIVTGKAHRLGLRLRQDNHRPAPPRIAPAPGTKRGFGIVQPKASKTVPAFVPFQPAAAGQAVPPRLFRETTGPAGAPTLRDLERSDCRCRWPLGDARQEADSEQRFCGAKYEVAAGRPPYCSEHWWLSLSLAERQKQEAKLAKPHPQRVAA